MLSRIDRCRSGRILSHQPDLLAERLLGDAGDILPVDQNPPAFQIVETEQQVDQRGLSGTRASDQPDLLARRDGERQVADDPLVLAIVEMDMVIANLAFRDLKRGRFGRIDQLVRLSDGFPCLPERCPSPRTR